MHSTRRTRLRRVRGLMAALGLKKLMTQGSQKVAFLILLLLATASGIAAIYLSYKSGCAGDLKTGVLGDPQLAIQIGNRASGAFLLALFAGSLAFVIRPALAFSSRVKHAASWFFASAVILWAASFQAAVMGTQACFPPQLGIHGLLPQGADEVNR